MEEDRDQIEIEPSDLIELEEEKILRRAAEIKAKQIKSAGRSMERTRRTQNHKFELGVQQYFNQQRDRIEQALNGTKKAENENVWDAIGITEEEFRKLSQAEQQSLTMQFVNGLLNWKEEEKLLDQILTPLWAETYDAGAEDVIRMYRIPAINRPELTSTARLRGGQRITQVTQTTKDQIAKIVSEGLETGKGRQELTEEIMDAMGTTETRARTIAAQECNTSLLAGNFDMAQRGGFSTKTWHVTNVGKARDTHRELNGKTVMMSEPFVTSKGNKLMMPCDPNCTVASETVNCHCFLTYD